MNFNREEFNVGSGESKSVFLKVGCKYSFFDIDTRNDKIGMVVSFDNNRAVMWVNNDMKSVSRKFIKKFHMDKDGNR